MSDRKRTKRTLHRLAIYVAVMLVVAGCSEPEVAEQTPSRPVVVTPVTVRELEERIEASGQLLAKHRAEVAAQVSGEVTEFLVEEGDEVASGEIVVEIDPEKRVLELDAARARVGEARASVAEKQREVDRMKALAAQKIAAETRLDGAETALETAQSRLSVALAELGIAQRAVQDATVRARFSGFIARRYVNRGEFVTASQKLFELVSLDPIEVEFHLPEADSSRARKGIAIDVSVSPYPDEVFHAVVHMLSPTIDRRTRTLRVKALLQNADGRLRPGLFARANLGIAVRSGVITVPEEAVLRRADGAIVYRVIAGNRVERLNVTTGTTRDGWIEIRSGLAPGDSVISRGHADLIDGSVITARHADGTPADSLEIGSVSAAVAGGESNAGSLP